MTYPTTYPGARQRLIPINHSDGGMTVPTRGLIPHVQMGTAPLFGWFSNPAAGVSSHLWLSTAGDFDQYVEFDNKAWAQAAGNSQWISVECAGTDADNYTAIQVQRLGELFAWGMRVFGWRAQITDRTDGYGLGTHRMGGAAWGGHSCPGDIRANRRGDILAAALGRPATPSPPEDDVPLTDAEINTIADRAAAKMLAALWAQMGDVKPAVRQGDVGDVLAQTYNKAGDLQSTIARIEAYLSGPFSAWTASQETALREIRTLFAGGAVADPAAAVALLERLDSVLAAFAAPRTYTVIPTGDPHA
ncbi:N-acetylmuramoyl-L-alanine amidase [Frankia sp. Mgl5]|uniref:peptidoglycan recognition protein family protein n=1 Tax=Frankia sp. Mgl5 TaxID=2933793 RepID=UPI00200E1505|nr:N-acetylmuramoyl-L-alanine amidase [Frankia sp. Mgl5]MCK9928816.1 N-acetylmuramoyl-L-alanine amidase [Frankia sp. Mgl5]